MNDEDVAVGRRLGVVENRLGAIETEMRAMQTDVNYLKAEMSRLGKETERITDTLSRLPRRSPESTVPFRTWQRRRGSKRPATARRGESTRRWRPSP